MTLQSLGNEDNGAIKEDKTKEESHAEGEKIADLMAQLTTEEVTAAMDQVFEEMLSGMKVCFALVNR